MVDLYFPAHKKWEHIGEWWEQESREGKKKKKDWVGSGGWNLGCMAVKETQKWSKQGQICGRKDR